MANLRVLYIDAGGWYGGQKNLAGKDLDPLFPTTTFVLIAHDSVALCSFNHIPGGWRWSGPSLTPGEMTSVTRRGSGLWMENWIFKFLDTMMGTKLGKQLPQPDLIGLHQHILNFERFAPGTFFEATGPKKLVVLIPDLHLSYFKDSALDNFVTDYEEVRLRGRHRDEYAFARLKKRRSLEIEFGQFLETISILSKANPKSIEVSFLGDVYELWETRAMARWFQNYKPDNEQNLIALLRTVNDIINPLVKAVNPAAALDLNDYAGRFSASLGHYQGILYNPDILNTALNPIQADVAQLIASSHKGENGKTFLDYFNEMFSNPLPFGAGSPLGATWRIIGNHDNLLVNDTSILGYNFIPKPFNVDEFGKYPERGADMQRNGRTPFLYLERRFNRSLIWGLHGHELDNFNKNSSCGLGYYLTFLNALSEVKGLGDEIKAFEPSLIPPEVNRKAYTTKYLTLLAQKERDLDSLRVVLLIQAHTHKHHWEDLSSRFEQERSDLRRSQPDDRYLKLNDLGKIVQNQLKSAAEEWLYDPT